jgi:hypothetical protein
MFDGWDHLPRWATFAAAIGFLWLSVYAAMGGVWWPWGFGLSAVLFILTFRRSTESRLGSYFDGDTSEPDAIEMIPNSSGDVTNDAPERR